MIEKQEIATYKTIRNCLGVSTRTAQKLALHTRVFYNKKEKELITIAQVLKANNLNA